MTEKIELQLISRRTAFSILGVTGALSVAVPATLLTVSNAKAQTPGMERREDRREDRQDRREDRRDDRQERRDDRQGQRQERRDERSGVSDQPATTGGSSSK